MSNESTLLLATRTTTAEGACSEVGARAGVMMDRAPVRHVHAHVHVSGGGGQCGTWMASPF